MYSFFLILGVGVVLTAGLLLTQKNIHSEKCLTIASTPIVDIKDDSFDPETLAIKKCSKVTFRNVGQLLHWPASNLHPTHGIYLEFDPQAGIEPGKQWSFIFEKVGKWRYHDHLFPAVRGEVQVYE